mmetsp:Transcript_75325/g.140458  ORF Transcript_75325/g.140458 Transcript_75325/m.140458 type:complete len:498 (+) Transcript_75325:65-1558(+)
MLRPHVQQARWLLAFKCWVGYLLASLGFRMVKPKGVSETQVEHLRTDFRAAANRTSALLAPVQQAAALPEVAALLMLSSRLQLVSLQASPALQSSIEKACNVITLNAPCPQVRVVAEEQGFELLTLPTEMWRRQSAVFLSGALVKRATADQIGALLAREVELLRTKHLFLPEVWAIKNAVQGTPLPTQARRQRPPSRLREAKERTRGLPLQMCRTYVGITALAASTMRLPIELQGPTEAALGKVLLPKVCGDIADVAVEYDANGAAQAVRQFGRKASYWADELEVKRLMHMASLAKQLPLPKGKLKDKLKQLTQPRKIWSKVKLAYKIGIPKLERMLTVAVRIVHPFKRASLSKLGPLLGLYPVLELFWTLGMLWRRSAELAADRVAAQVYGSIAPVAGGLTWRYGTAEEKRRVQRGETMGLIEDAQIQYAPGRRGQARFEAFVEAEAVPPLRLRLAEMADWAQTEDGRTAMKQGVVARFKNMIAAVVRFLRHLVAL